MTVREAIEKAKGTLLVSVVAILLGVVSTLLSVISAMIISNYSDIKSAVGSLTDSVQSLNQDVAEYNADKRSDQLRIGAVEKKTDRINDHLEYDDNRITRIESHIGLDSDNYNRGSGMR